MSFRGIPLVRILMPFVMGIYCQLSCSQFLEPRFFLPLIGLLFLILLMVHFRVKAYRHRWWFGLLLSVTFFFFGYARSLQFDKTNDPLHLNRFSTKTIHLQGTVQAIQPKANWHSIQLKAQFVANDSGAIKPVVGDLLVYLEPDQDASEIQVGSNLFLKTVLHPIAPPKNPKAFDFRRFMELKGVTHQCFVHVGEWRVNGISKGYGLSRWTAMKREELNEKLAYFHQDTSKLSILQALVLGNKRQLNEEVTESYAGSGAMHILAVSGLHVGIIYLLISFLLKLMPFKYKGSRLFSTVVLLLGIWGFALITGASPSVIRAATMFSFIRIGKAIHRNASIYNILSASALFTLLINPYQLGMVSFQLSYLAVLGIVFFHPIIYKWLYFENGFGQKIWSLVALSIAAQLTTFPLSLFYFHQFPVYFWLSGIFAVPAAGVILVIGLLELLTFPITWLSGFLAVCADVIIGLLNHVMAWINELPGAQITGVWLEPFGVFSLYFAILCLVFLTITKKRSWGFGFIAILMMLGTWSVYRIWHLDRQDELLVFHINQGSCFAFFSGGRHYTFHTDNLTEKDLLYATENFELYKRSQQKMTRLLYDNHFGNNIYKNGPYVQVNGFKLLIIGPDYDINEQIGFHFDAVLLQNNPGVSLVELEAHFCPDVIIADGSNQFYQRRKWQKEAFYNFYDTGEEGAWRYRFKKNS